MVIIKRWQELENQSLKPQLPDFYKIQLKAQRYLVKKQS
ncbi:transcriptional regulator [Acinetobacter phage Ab69]|nr:transcriptional regulator [Acinetobacter phage Ab69]